MGLNVINVIQQYLRRIALASKVRKLNEACLHDCACTLIQFRIWGFMLRSSHAESTWFAIRIQSAFWRHGEARTYSQWRDSAAKVQRWGRGEISMRWVRDLREAEMGGNIRDLLSEMKKTATPSDNVVASTTVTTPTTMATTALYSSS